MKEDYGGRTPVMCGCGNQIPRGTIGKFTCPCGRGSEDQCVKCHKPKTGPPQKSCQCASVGMGMPKITFSRVSKQAIQAWKGGSSHEWCGRRQ